MNAPRVALHRESDDACHAIDSIIAAGRRSFSGKPTLRKSAVLMPGPRNFGSHAFHSSVYPRKNNSVCKLKSCQDEGNCEPG